MIKKTSYSSLINGKWVDSKKTLNIYNPSNGEILGELFDVGPKGAENAVNSADKAFRTWSSETAKFRSNILKNWYKLIIEKKTELAEIITLESGKPLNESLVEVDYGASFIEWFAEQALRTKGDVLSSPEKSKKMFIVKQPIGVVSAITPWNFPLAMVTRKAAAAIAAGCTVVLKPSELTPISAITLADLSIKSGLPAGVFNVVNGEPKAIGEVLSTHPLVKKITFTGSTKVGKDLMKNAADTIKGISLELGGNAPFIIFDDAVIDDSINGLVDSKFRNAGQTCISSNRVFVHEKIKDEFIQKLKQRIMKLKVGSGMKNSDIGPLISKKAVEKIKEHIEDALNFKGNIEMGGKSHQAGELFYEPTIITNVNENMKIFKSENFGPVIPIIFFNDDDEVIKLANNTEYGLAAYFFTNNSKRIWKMVEELEFGMFGINSGKISTYLNPFGGMKESGIGREGSSEGLEPFLEKKFISWSL